MQKKNTFYAMLARMKYIKRWALMQQCRGRKYQRAFFGSSHSFSRFGFHWQHPSKQRPECRPDRHARCLP